MAFYRAITAVRHANPALRTGEFSQLYARGQVYAFHRALPQQEALVVINAGTKETAVALPLPTGAAAEFRQVWPPAAQPAAYSGVGTLRVPPREALVLVS